MPLSSLTPDQVARLAGGLCTSADFVTAGVPAGRVRGAVATDVITRLRRGFYAVPDAPPSGVLAVRAGARLAGLSAAASFGLWSGWDAQLHLCVRGHAGHVAGRSQPGTRSVRLIDGEAAIMHWNDDRRDAEWCWRVSLERCIGQVLRWCDTETALAVVDTALTSGLLDVDRLASLCVGPTAILRSGVLRCRVGAQSGVESIARQRLEKLGLELRLQPEIPGVGHVDIGIAGTRVYIELDGYRFHSTPAQFSEDRRRDAEARSRGYVPLRFSAEQVRDRWPWAERMILGSVAQFAAHSRGGR